MIDFQFAYKTVRPSIVGVGFSDFQGNCRVIGTGFIVHPSGWIISNRHVLEPLLYKNNDEIRIRPNAAVMLFVKANPSQNFIGVAGVIPAKISELAFPPNEIELNPKMGSIKYKDLEPIHVLSPEEPDIGVCKIEPSILPPEVHPLTAVEIVNSVGYEEGTNIGIIGFPQGLSISPSISEISSLQLTPLLQVGIISAVLPFSGIPKPTNYVLDLFVNPGSSGSPLFTKNGKVIGVVYATRQSFTPLVIKNRDGNVEEEHNQGVYIPSGLGLAIPSSRFPKDLVNNNV